MPDHDQFFKQLLQEFFGDLLHIVAPTLAEKLRIEDPRFLKDELFLDPPTGERRFVDLVAQVESIDGPPEVVLVHVEVEARARRTMGLRLYEYAMQLWLRHRRPVVPIVLYLRGGKPDVTRETVRIDVHGEVFMSFSYLAFGVSRSTATDYLQRPEPLAWALAGLMRTGDLSPAHRRLACLRKALGADLDDAHKYLLINCIETYVQLDPPDQEEYDALLAGEENREVAVMEMTWADRIAHEARENALQEGKRDLLRELLERRFGPLPASSLERLQALASPEDLSRLAAGVLDARSLDDLGL